MSIVARGENKPNMMLGRRRQGVAQSPGVVTGAKLHRIGYQWNSTQLMLVLIPLAHCS
jgi:hypothetical protein